MTNYQGDPADLTWPTQFITSGTFIQIYDDTPRPDLYSAFLSEIYSKHCDRLMEQLVALGFDAAISWDRTESEVQIRLPLKDVVMLGYYLGESKRGLAARGSLKIFKLTGLSDAWFQVVGRAGTAVVVADEWCHRHVPWRIRDHGLRWLCDLAELALGAPWRMVWKERRAWVAGASDFRRKQLHR